MDKLDEKISTVVPDPPPEEMKGQVLPDWTSEEERRAVRKLDYSLLIIFMLAQFVVAVDQGNISSTLTSTILEDLSIGTNEINTGTQLLLAGNVLFELPFNLLLQHTRAHPFLTAQIMSWGLVATFQAFIKNYPSFLATRFILGAFEAGFVPGAIYVLTLWYKPEEYSSRIAFFYVGKILSSALSTLLAAGILNLDGHLGWGGWRWLFFLEGILTLVVGVAFLLFIPQSVANPRPLIGAGRWKYFTNHEEHILAERLALRGAEYSAETVRPGVKDVLRTFVNYRLWLHVAVTMLSAAAMHGMIVYTPAMIKTFGFDRIQSNALASVGYFGSVVWTMGLARIGEKTGWRGPMVLAAATWAVITYSCMNLIPRMDARWTQFALLTLSNVGGITIHVLNVGWLVYHTREKVSRGVYSAIMVMAVNLGGLSGGQVLREDDAPLYINGFRTMSCVMGGCWISVVILSLDYFLEERRERQQAEVQETA